MLPSELYANGRGNRLSLAEYRQNYAVMSVLGRTIISDIIFLNYLCSAPYDVIYVFNSGIGIAPAIMPCVNNERNTAMQLVTNMAQTQRLASGYRMTDHAWRRMTSRGLSEKAVEAVLTYGRTFYVRGAEIHALGRREVERYRNQSVDLRPFEGLQVVCVPDDGVVMTVYRNHDLSSLRRSRGRLGRQRPRFRF